MVAAQLLAASTRPRTRFGEVPRYPGGLYRLRRATYAWMVPNGSWGETNLGLVDGGHQSVLIDTAWDLGFNSEFQSAVRDILERSPVACVVNTHADGDHCWGNQLFADATIVGSHRCIEQMEHVTPRTLLALKMGARWARHVPFAGIAEFGRYVEGMFRPYAFEGRRPSSHSRRTDPAQRRPADRFSRAAA